MDLTGTRARLNDLEQNLREAKFAYKKALEVKEQVQKLETGLRKAESLIADLECESKSLKILEALSGKEEAAYKQRRLGFVDDEITKKLKYIFPKQDLTAVTECDFKRKRTQADLYLRDKKGNMRPPFITEGKYAQQSISYAATEAICTLLEKKELFLDEAFSNSDPDNLIKTQDLLESSVKEGFQIILVSHSPLVYNDIPRREIHLQSSRGDEVDLVETWDFEEVIQ